MMRVLFSPQVPAVEGQRIHYTFGNDVITAEIDGQTDTFDFSEMPDGEAVDIETTLPVNPIISARRINGVLEVVLLNWIEPDAPESERFPDWIEVGKEEDDGENQVENTGGN